ncbi:MAG: FAD-dependent oxidoreductase, partial [Bacteroidota bacterium]
MIREDVIVIGGGLAGLTAAIQLAIDGVGVLVIERDPYPRHRVCGEYLSQEVVPYLMTLGIDLKIAGAVTIQRMEISTRSGESVSAELPLGGVGVSRYCLDMLLYQRAVGLGVRFQFDLVQSVDRHLNHFELQTRVGKIFQCNYIVGAFGK